MDRWRDDDFAKLNQCDTMGRSSHDEKRRTEQEGHMGKRKRERIEMARGSKGGTKHEYELHSEGMRNIKRYAQKIWERHTERKRYWRSRVVILV